LLPEIEVRVVIDLHGTPPPLGKQATSTQDFGVLYHARCPIAGKIQRHRRGTELPDCDVQVRLRTVCVEDAEMIADWRSEATARRYQPLREMPFEELREQIAKRSKNEVTPDAEGEFQWIIETEDGPVGWIGLTMISREHGLATIGYTIAEPFRGNGYATAAVKAVQPIAFAPKQLDLARLEPVAAVDNIASRKVLERAGFELEGIARAYLVVNGERLDHARYALLRENYRLGEGKKK
jgi:ribosomal-protein-alanine N-acetyltransferase